MLVADCEGFLEVFFDENPSFYDNLRLIIFEADYPDKCNYDKIKHKLMEKNFYKILEGHQNVWIKMTPKILKRVNLINKINTALSNKYNNKLFLKKFLF